ncbi:hypothetical protein ACS0TY_018045 [Phlomoides rotata]
MVVSSTIQVWLRIFELPLEFWDSALLWRITHTVGNPIKVGDKTLSGEVRHYAPVLIDVDFKRELPESIMVESVLWPFLSLRIYHYFVLRVVWLGI